VQVADPTGSYGFAYDNMGRLIGTSTQYSFLPGLNFQNSYGYDAASNRTSLTVPDGSVTAYGYDTLNRLNGLANSWAGSFGFSYDALSRRTLLTRPNGVNTSYAYDRLSHLLSVLHQAGVNTLDGAAYTYDPAGNRTSKTNYLNGVTSNYGYDLLYELTQVTQGASTTESYSYDPVGNRLSSLGVPNYSYNSSNELTSSSLGSYSYDANGNTLSDPSGKTYTWDFENRLTSVFVPGTGTVSFKYDPFGRRIQKSGPLGTTNYLYEGGTLIEEIDDSGNLLARYSEGTDVDELLTEYRSGTTSFYQRDGLGSVTSLSSTAGVLASTYGYDSFGKLTASTGMLTNPFKYTGREFDSETGIYYYRARYYDPGTGKFVSEDPLRFEIGINFYPYVQNDPVGHIDPSGLCPCGYHNARLYYTPHYGGGPYPDYHWYRQDSNGWWSSKHGWAKVGPQVGPDSWLVGPQPDYDARQSGYSVFCGMLCFPDNRGLPPIYNPVPWNDPSHIHTNNCYSYACDRMHPPGPPYKPQPGESMGYSPQMGYSPHADCTSVIIGAMIEGAIRDPFDTSLPIP
jgi:RHS repeat-associated protein